MIEEKVELEQIKAKKNSLKSKIRRAFSLHGDTADYQVIEDRILSGGEVKGTNLCILVLAALIASIGLNMNSTAVIIGAMLISPLMGGIMAVAYGLATSNLRQARDSAVGLGIQVAACLAISICYFLLSPINQPTQELLARTTPTIWDVMIACFGGLAGIIGTTRKEKSNVIPGVAIATALMPPLCTAGYGIAHGNLMYFLGAMYLFLINSYFICLSSTVVLLIIDVPKRSQRFSPDRLKKLKKKVIRNSIIVILPSIFFGAQMVRQEMLSNNPAAITCSYDQIDVERLTKEIKLVNKKVDKIEFSEKTAMDENEQVNTHIEVNIFTNQQLLPEEETILKDFLELNIENPVIVYH